MSKKIQALFFPLLLLLVISCKQEYMPVSKESLKDLLVVEGFINSGTGPTVIHLSRTTALKDSVLSRSENNAIVKVEGDDGSSADLTESGNGDYQDDQLSLSEPVQYRLHIKTQNGKEYVSEYSIVKHTPPVDSISWQRKNEGVLFLAHAHDAATASRYFRWKYEETWEYHSEYFTSLNYVFDPVTKVAYTVEYRHPDHSNDTTLYKCWKTIASSSVIVGSSENLSENIIAYPVQYIEHASEKLSILYSLMIKQYSVSKDAYLFYQRLKKNTEQIGSLFDAQPSQIKGNIRSLSDPAETVIGFVEVTDEKSARIFLSNASLPDWNYETGCVFVEVPNDIFSVAYAAYDLVPTNPAKLDMTGAILSFHAAKPACVYCTINHTNQRPDFWP